MPVYLFTAHAYRSWSADHPRGYVQHGDGVQPPNPELAAWRDEHANHPPVEFAPGDQRLVLKTCEFVCRERSLTLHAGATTPTHLHGLVSFASPACACMAADHCRPSCPGRLHVERFLGRLKSRAGLDLAKRNGTRGRPYFSRGWDLTPIRKQSHFDYHVEQYLPDHAAQNGLFQRYR